MNKFGIVVINKEKGFTSHDVVAVVKRTLKMKAGHTGTLDPMAEGVLSVCVGSATKLAGYLSADDKTYIAKVRLGVTTDTGDDTGEVLSRREVLIGGDSSIGNDLPGDGSPGDGFPGGFISREQIADAVLSFQGEQTQIPPMYSAVKVNGRKLYELARKGQTVERQPRRIIINQIKILEFFPEEQSFTMEVLCSKGTYIRSLCADIGEKLGCGACLSELTRTRSGIFTLDMAVKLRDLTENDLLNAEDVLPFPRAYAKPEAEKLVINGNPVPMEFITFEDAASPERPPEKYWLYHNETLRGLYRPDGDKLRPEVML